jgi:hypothetical protein
MVGTAQARLCPPYKTVAALMFRYALKYAICVVVASNRPDGDHNSPFWSP